MEPKLTGTHFLQTSVWVGFPTEHPLCGLLNLFRSGDQHSQTSYRVRIRQGLSLSTHVAEDSS